MAMSQEQNELLTRVGPGSRMGQLLRRYWQPIAGASEMADKWTMKVRVLGEDLVLFKDRNGKLGLIEEACAHRRTSLDNGIPIEGGIRCPYHGWAYNHTGYCIDRPNETTPAHFQEKPLLKAYPVQELGGLLFTYMGPAPAPELPRFESLMKEGTAIRIVGKAVIPCNWLQIMENSVDAVHVEWLHGKAFEFHMETKGTKRKAAAARKHVKIAFDEFQFGIIKRRVLEGHTEDHDDWKVGHPLVFPNILLVGSAGGMYEQHTVQHRVPIDDTHTMHFWYNAYVPPEGVEVKPHLLKEVPTYQVPFKDENGKYMFGYVHAQDIMAWVTQGAIADRTKEMLGATDVGLSTYRKLLLRELDKVEAGEDPIGILRDPKLNALVHLPLERDRPAFTDGFRDQFTRHVGNFSPIRQEILDVFAQSKTAEPRLVAAE